MLPLSKSQYYFLAGVNLLLMIALFFLFVFFFRKAKHKKKLALLCVIMVNIGLKMLAGGSATIISDEHMISHFYTHRDEIEMLLSEYLDNPDTLGDFRNSSDDIKAIKQQAAVERLTFRSNRWHENPYSLEAAKEFWADIKSKSSDMVRSKNTQDVYFSLTLKNSRIRHRRKIAYKKLLYIPRNTKIEDNKLLYPVSAIHPDRVNYKVISQNLDTIPNWLMPGDCTMKHIEGHWFLALCLSS